MGLLITAEQQMLRHELERLLSRSTAGTGEQDHARLWSQLSHELGLTGLCVPARFGGAEASFGDLATALEVLGHALYGGPYLSSAVVATHALLASGHVEAQHKHLPALARGERIASLIAPPLSHVDGRISARTVGGQPVLSGNATAVLDGATADLLLVVAETDDGPSLFAVESAATGVTRTQLESFDLTRNWAEVTFTAVVAEPIGAPGDAVAVISRVRRIAAFAIAAEQSGGARRCLDDATEYAKVRYQFGRPIGSFQAIKHMCADMYQHARSTHVAVRHAARCLDNDSPESTVASSMAKVYSSEAYLACATANLQIHGGIGFTWEETCHLHLRRARASAALFDEPGAHRDQLADELIGPGAEERSGESTDFAGTARESSPRPRTASPPA